MSNANNRNDSTNSGQGALGMGGQPSDDPRDSESGGGNPHDDRGGGTGPIPGAHGRGQKDYSGGNVAGVKGDKAVDQAIQNEAEGRG